MPQPNGEVQMPQMQEVPRPVRPAPGNDVPGPQGGQQVCPLTAEEKRGKLLSPDYSFLFRRLYSVFGLISFIFLFWHFLAPVSLAIYIYFFEFATGFCCLAQGWVM